jgi:hypothetical protein
LKSRTRRKGGRAVAQSRVRISEETTITIFLVPLSPKQESLAPTSLGTPQEPKDLRHFRGIVRQNEQTENTRRPGTEHQGHRGEPARQCPSNSNALLYTTAACWFVWLALRGRELAPQLALSVQLDTRGTKYVSLLGTPISKTQRYSPSYGPCDQMARNAVWHVRRDKSRFGQNLFQKAVCHDAQSSSPVIPLNTLRNSSLLSATAGK